MSQGARVPFATYSDAVSLEFPGPGNLCRLAFGAMLMVLFHGVVYARGICQPTPGLWCGAAALWRQADGPWGVALLAALVLWAFWHAVSDYLREVRRWLGHGAFWRGVPEVMRLPLGLVTVPVLLSRIAAVPIVWEEVGGVQRKPASAFFGLARGTHKVQVESRWRRSTRRPQIGPAMAILLLLGLACPYAYTKIGRRRFQLVPNRTGRAIDAQDQDRGRLARNYTRISG